MGSKTLKPKNILNRSKVRSGIDIRLHNDHYANQNWDAKCKYNNSYGKQPQEISDTTKRHPKQNAMTLFSKSVGTLACDEETRMFSVINGVVYRRGGAKLNVMVRSSMHFEVAPC